MSWWTPERQNYAVNYLVSAAGLSPIGAAGLVSRWMNVEAAGGPASINPYSGAFGIAQWLGSRLAPIRGNTSFDAQLAYAARELNSSESRAASHLRAATTADQAAIGASMFERAEGYDLFSGRDNFTNRTAAGIPNVLASVGINATPTVADNANGADAGNLNSNGIFSDSTTPDATGSIPAVLLIGGGLLALYFILQ